VYDTSKRMGTYSANCDVEVAWWIKISATSSTGLVMGVYGRSKVEERYILE
jgi:hypothetical protein